MAISTTGTRPEFLERAVAGWTEAGLVPYVITDTLRDGVAATKNRGLAEMIREGHDHLFLADDDMHPLSRESWERYVSDPEPHLMLCWGGGRLIAHHDDGHSEWRWPRGVLLYATREAVELVGGMRTEYGTAHEHADFSRRVHQAGLTRYMFQDIDQNPRDWFVAEDMPRPGERAHEVMARRRRITTIKRTAADKRRIAQLWRDLDGNTDFVPYR